MGKAFKINKNNTIPIPPHSNYLYGTSNKRFNRIKVTTKLPDYFVSLGGTYTGSSYRTHCGYCVFDGNLYTFSGRGNNASGDKVGSTAMHIDNLGDGYAKNDDTYVDTTPSAHLHPSAFGLVIYNGLPHIAATNGFVSTSSSNGDATSTTHLFDIYKGLWISAYMTALTPAPRRMGMGGIIDRNYIYSIGGSNSSNTIVNSNYEIHLGNQTVATKAALPGVRQLGASCVVNNRYIYILGGASTSKAISSSFFRYDVSNNSWSSLLSFPFTTRSGCLIHDQRNTDRIWYFAGSSTVSFSATNRIYYYSISSSTWTQFNQNLPISCRSLNGFCTPEGVMILFNFETTTYKTTNNIYAFDPDPYTSNPTSDTRPNMLILYCNSLLGRNRRVRPVLSSKITGNPYINLFAIKEINNKVPGPLLYAGSSVSTYREAFLKYFNTLDDIIYTLNEPNLTSINTNNILDYSVKEIGGMFKWDKL